MFLPPKLLKPTFLQFRAGKMKYTNGMVHPDTRKGYLSFMKGPANTIEVAWTGEDTEIEDLYVWKRSQVDVSFVEKCTTGRVLLFKVKADDRERLHFFWLQDKSDAKDRKYLATLKEAFSLRSAPGAAATSVQLDELKKIISSISGSGAASDVQIADLIASSKVSDAVRADPDFYKSRLQDTLPAELASSDSILAQIKNPQVTHAASVLGAGLRDPQTCKELCKMYGLPETTAGVSGFINAILSKAKKAD